MICKMIECPYCKKRTPHRLVTDTTLCLICGNYATNPNQYKKHENGVMSPDGNWFYSAEDMFKHLEMDV